MDIRSRIWDASISGYAPPVRKRDYGSETISKTTIKFVIRNSYLSTHRHVNANVERQGGFTVRFLVIQR